MTSRMKVTNNHETSIVTLEFSFFLFDKIDRKKGSVSQKVMYYLAAEQKGLVPLL